MATISYTFVSRCVGGGHTAVDVSYNGGAANRVVYSNDDINLPLSALTADERANLALYILKVHMAGKTRAQMVTEFQAGPVTVTV